MKCPNCQRNHKPGKGRNLTCTCRYRFAFDPKQHDGMSDGKFLALWRQASQHETAYFTLNQLYTHYCRMQQKPSRLFLILGVALAGGALVLALLTRDLVALGIIACVAALVCFGIAAYRKFRAPPSRERLQQLVERWRRAGRPVDRLLTTPSLHTPPPAWQEPDIYDYGVERLLLVEHDLLVDLLVRNELHVQERALILSEHGYPSYLLPLAVRCLQENPQLPVYLLHDATPKGRHMAIRVRNSTLLPLAEHTVLDLGLFPEDIKRLRRLRALQPQRQDFALPVDCLPMAFLAAGVAQALLANLAFSAILPQDSGTHTGTYEGGMDFG